ncbi:hypothetical protein [Alistipes sp.]|uniref:hypothetical protein n=1 Tax=Alistipes sp. TaxID=1872444 RepID=UPI003AF1233E
MKTFKYLWFAFLAAFVLAGCTDDIDYTPGEGEDPNSYGVYFPSQDNSGDVELDPADETVLEFKAMRRKTDDAIVVPVEVTSSQEGLFKVSEIKFEAGQPETTFTVSFDGAEVAKTYSCSLMITDKRFAYNYGEYANGIAFSVTRVQWNLVKGPNGETKGKWRDELFTGIMGSNIKDNGVPYAEKDVEIYERADMPGYYRIKDIYDAAYMYKIVGYNYSNVVLVPGYTIIDARDKEKVYFPAQPAGFAITGIGYEDDGAFMIVSFCQENYPDIASATSYGKFENGILTFPPKGVMLTLPSIWKATSFYTANTEIMRLMLPGAQEYDYSVAFTSAPPADGKVNITATLGKDVAKVKYAYFEGELSASVVASKSLDIDAGSVPTKEITASGTITAELEETGIYTLVGNSYNAAGVLQKYGAVTFGYVKKGDERPVVMTVRTELSWEHEAQGHTPENSIKGIIFGEDIKSGFYALMKTDQVKNVTDADLIASLKAGGNPFSAEQLEKINSTGYAPFFINLDKGTSFTLLVLGDNGFNNKLFRVEQETAGKADPLQRKYTIEDLYTFKDKADLLKTWDLWGVNNDGSGKTSRAKIGQVTFSENTEGDSEEQDVVNVSGLSLGANQEDTVLWEWYNGVIYVLKGQPMGTISYQGATLYLKYYILDKEKSMGANSIDGMMVGGLTEDGYLALVSAPDWVKQGYNFDTILVQAFDNAECEGKTIGNWESYTSPLMVEAGASGAAVVKKSVSEKLLMLSQEMSINPSNFVELRGRQRAHALIDEMIGKPLMRSASLEGEVTTRVVTPLSSTFSTQIVRPVGDGTIRKMPVHNYFE